jgi:hypothetical protein
LPLWDRPVALAELTKPLCEKMFLMVTKEKVQSVVVGLVVLLFVASAFGYPRSVKDR